MYAAIVAEGIRMRAAVAKAERSRAAEASARRSRDVSATIAPAVEEVRQSQRSRERVDCIACHAAFTPRDRIARRVRCERCAVICRRCGTEPAADGRRLCAACNAARADERRNYDAAKKREHRARKAA